MLASLFESRVDRIQEQAMLLLLNRMVLMILVNVVCFPQINLVSNRRKYETLFVNMTSTIIFEVIIFFLCFLVSNYALQKKSLTVLLDNHAATMIDFCVQRLLKD